MNKHVIALGIIGAIIIGSMILNYPNVAGFFSFVFFLVLIDL